MENASKALLIGASILFVVMVLSLVMMFYDDVSSYYQSESDITAQEQLADFNKNFENYHREQIRGSDMISLMNKVIDYNRTQTYQVGTNYERIEVSIDLKNRNIVNQFKYDTDPSADSIIDSILTNYKITNETAANANLDQQKIADNRLTGITGIENNLLEVLQNELGVQSPTSGQLQTLAANIGNIMIKDSSNANDNWTIVSTEINNRLRRKDLIETTFNNIVINFRNDGIYKGMAVANRTSQDIIDKIKEIALQYYQFTQFKRAYFDCTEVRYDPDTGRISEMYFEIRTDASGLVEFN